MPPIAAADVLESSVRIDLVESPVAVISVEYDAVEVTEIDVSAVEAVE